MSIVRPKLISVWTLPDSRKRYLGTSTFVKMPALTIRLRMPRLVDSANQE